MTYHSLLQSLATNSHLVTRGFSSSTLGARPATRERAQQRHVPGGNSDWLLCLTNGPDWPDDWPYDKPHPSSTFGGTRYAGREHITCHRPGRYACVASSCPAANAKCRPLTRTTRLATSCRGGRRWCLHTQIGKKIEPHLQQFQTGTFTTVSLWRSQFPPRRARRARRWLLLLEYLHVQSWQA